MGTRGVVCAWLAGLVTLAAPAWAEPRGVTPVERAERAGAHADTVFAGAYAVTYYGGRVVSNVKVYQVSWGPSTDATVKAGLPAFYAAITSGPYFDWLSEYDTRGKTGADGQPGSSQHIGHGTFGGAFTITPSVTSTTLTDEQIQTELAGQIASGALPQPDVDAAGNVNAVYMIDFPPGDTLEGPAGAGTSCEEFCGYHSTVSIGGKSVPYGVLPDIGGACLGGCGMEPLAFDNATAVHAHELVESVTDTEVGLAGSTAARPLAWYDTTANAGEIGDICNTQHARVGSYVVQTLWSNAVGSCIAQRADLTVCNGSNAACKPCTADTDCSTQTPYCETNTTSAMLGQCVACSTNAQCSGATPICDQSEGSAADTCRACASAADCGQGAPTCATSGAAAGRCVQCLADTDCAIGVHCNTESTFVCEECTTDAQCKNPTPFCTASQQCVACTTNEDCASSEDGPACVEGSCVPASGADGGPSGNAAGFGGSAFPDTNHACAASPGGPASSASGLTFVAAAAFAAARRRRRRAG